MIFAAMGCDDGGGGLSRELVYCSWMPWEEMTKAFRKDPLPPPPCIPQRSYHPGSITLVCVFVCVCVCASVCVLMHGDARLCPGNVEDPVCVCLCVC